MILPQSGCLGRQGLSALQLPRGLTIIGWWLPRATGAWGPFSDRSGLQGQNGAAI